MGPNLSFDRPEVVAAAGVDPWARQENFQNELNPEDIAATRDTYLRAAEQATSVQDIATQASQISQTAGGNDGAPLVDGADRDQQTADGMQQGGADIAAVGDTLNRAMNRAIAAHDEVLALIPPLNVTLATNVQAAVDEYNAWVASVQGVPLEPGTAEAMAEGIRQKWIEQTAQAASTADGEITAAVEAYRMDMMTQANELQYLGYVPSEGPFQLFTTPEMGEWAAAGLNNALQQENPNQQDIDRYIDGLQAINSGIYGNPAAGTTGPQEAQRNMTPEERAYLDAFYGTASADTLAALGSNESLSGAATTVANGIDTLMNPEIGGIDSAGNAEGVPASIAEYLYGYDQQITDQASVDQFNGFGALMESATVAPSDTFAYDAGMAALGVQQAVDQRNLSAAENAQWNPELASEGEPLQLTGSSDLLSHAALSATASQGLLSDPGVRNQALGADWQDSQGIADVIGSATRPDENGVMTAEQEGIADGVLTYYADNPAELIHDWDDPTPLLAYDNVPLQGAVAEAALLRMDDIVGFGQSAPTYTEGDTYGVFSLMAATDPTVNEYFKTGINAAEYELAHGMYSGAIADRANAATDINDLNSLVNWGEQDVLNHYGDREDKADKLMRDLATASVGAAAGFVGAAVPGAAVGAAAAGSGASLATPLFGEFEPQTPKDLANYQIDQGLVNDELAQYQVTAAAIAAHNERVPEDQHIDPPDASAILGGSDDFVDLKELDGAVNQHLNNPELGLGSDLDWVTDEGDFIKNFSPDDARAAEQRLESEAVEARAAERAARNGE